MKTKQKSSEKLHAAIVRKAWLKKEIDQEIAELLVELRAICPHDYVAERGMLDFGFDSAIPPRRICENCFLEEDGWGCGYGQLRNREGRKVRGVDPHEFSMQTIKNYIDD